MRLAAVALAASLTILGAVIMNLAEDGSDLPLPDVIELQGEAAPDMPEADQGPLSAPAVPPPVPPIPPGAAGQAADQPPSAFVAGEQAPPNPKPQRNSTLGARAQSPAGGSDEEVPHEVNSSLTGDYERCDEDEMVDPDDPDDCEEVDEPDADDPDDPDEPEAAVAPGDDDDD